MQDTQFLKTDINQNDIISRSQFLSLAEELLAGSSFQKASEIARARLVSVPGDIDAKMILGRALIGLGNKEEAFEIFANIRSSLERWSSMLDLLEDQARIHLPAYFPEISASTDSPQIEADRIGHTGGQPLHGDFYTMTMAELFIKQGHFEMARQVLEGILKLNPHEPGALARLEELKGSLDEAPATPLQSRALNELEKWQHKLKFQR